MDRSIIARAQEIIQTNGATHGRDALRTALDERFQGNYTRMLDTLTDEGMNKMKDLRKQTYNLPEQPTLFDIPSVIAVSTPLGDLFIPNDMATAGQVEQWSREGEQHHGSQHKRFKAIRQQIKSLSLDPSENYRTQVAALTGGTAE